MNITEGMKITEDTINQAISEYYEAQGVTKKELAVIADLNNYMTYMNEGDEVRGADIKYILAKLKKLDPIGASVASVAAELEEYLIGHHIHEEERKAVMDLSVALAEMLDNGVVQAYEYKRIDPAKFPDMVKAYEHLKELNRND
jgi:DNA-directed RNA polymerase specialized sigma54-like protein